MDLSSFVGKPVAVEANGKKRVVGEVKGAFVADGGLFISAELDDSVRHLFGEDGKKFSFDPNTKLVG